LANGITLFYYSQSNYQYFSLGLGVIAIIIGLCSIYLGTGKKPPRFFKDDYLNINSKGLSYKFGFSKKSIAKEEIHSMNCTSEIFRISIRGKASVFIGLDSIENKQKQIELKEFVKAYQKSSQTKDGAKSKLSLNLLKQY